jgi:hypothetical protein
MNTTTDCEKADAFLAGSTPETLHDKPLNPSDQSAALMADNAMTLNIYSENGSRMEFYQEDLSEIEKTLALLIQPRLFTQPLLALASQYNATTIPSRTIDLIRVQSLVVFPLVMPAGILNIVEVGSDAISAEPKQVGKDTESETGVMTEFLELHTTGGWVVFLRLESITTGSVQDRRQVLMHFYELPTLPFRCLPGGLGFINPTKICRMTICPGFKGVPANALPAGLLRWESWIQRKDPA